MFVPWDGEKKKKYNKIRIYLIIYSYLLAADRALARKGRNYEHHKKPQCNAITICTHMYSVHVRYTSILPMCYPKYGPWRLEPITKPKWLKYNTKFAFSIFREREIEKPYGSIANFGAHFTSRCEFLSEILKVSKGKKHW